MTVVLGQTRIGHELLARIEIVRALLQHELDDSRRGLTIRSTLA